jgi:hypothetical protein
MDSHISVGMRARICACGLVAMFAVTGASAVNGPLTARGVQAALIRDGYPARTQCGEVIEPPPPRSSRGRIVSEQTVPACWVLVERDGFSLHVTPHSNAAAAKLTVRRIQNRWANQSRNAAIGYVVLSGYRTTKTDWLRISRAVASAIGVHP